ncbi:TPA: c-type cytochrome biogenesis protein CcmI [Photobacterium damselae]
MILFWLLTAVIVLFCGAIFVYPMLSHKEIDDVANRDELNKAFYKERVDELAHEAEEGLVEDQQELVAELQQSLLDDIPAQEEEKKSKVSLAMLLPGFILLVGISYGMYFALGGIQKVEAWHKTIDRLPELTQRLMSEQAGEPLSDQDMSDLTLGLRTRLHDHPNDAQGWYLLGRIAMSNRDADTAKSAMKRAYDLDPNNTEYQLGYAQTLMLIDNGNPGSVDYARQLLRHVIKQDHTNMTAMSLLAFDAFEHKEYEQAISYWSMMKALSGSDESRVAMLDRSIARAQAMLNKAAVAPTTTVAKEEAQAKKNGVAADKSVRVTINLGPNVKMPKQGMIMVSVHNASGAPMPIAARRLPLDTKFPLTLTLDDKDNMMPTSKLSDLPDMIIKARIDSDGDVMSKQGDYYGESVLVPLGGSTEMTIDKQY